MESRDILLHGNFTNDFMKYVFREEKFHEKGEINRVPYGKEILICPEPITFLSELDDFSNDQKACIAGFKDILRKSKRIQLGYLPGNEDGYLWFNTTKNGINLRPGIDSASNMPSPVTMGDNAVHGLMAGQTGSGKSAMLNNLIFNLLTEYPPWELDLYLADFKKVEFSRYMNKFITPHVSACAATGEIRYVISLIQYLVDCMNARENLFARLGVQKISDLRDSKEFAEDFPDIVLPRMLLIVDEFQQMFLDANAREGEQIRSMLTAIVKKGRATGLHILFASQEMSNTLSRSDLANFRIRFALNCSMGVSMDVIGNKGATSIQKGQVIYNTSDGTDKTNRIFRVPYVETDVNFGESYSYFESFLANMRRFAAAYGFTKNQKFYQEDLQSPFLRKDSAAVLEDVGPKGKYDDVLNRPKTLSLEETLERIENYRAGFYGEAQRKKYYEILTLGDYVTFSNLHYDIQTLFLEYGRNKNILAISPRMEDIAYLEKLFSYNFITSPRQRVTGISYQHVVYSFQPGVTGLFSLPEALDTEQIYTNPEDLSSLQLLTGKRRMLMRLCQDCATPFEFAMGNYRANLEAQRRTLSSLQAEKMEQEAEQCFRNLFSGISVDEIPKTVQGILRGSTYNPVEKTTARNLLTMHQYHMNPGQAFPPIVIWLVGIDSVERIPEWLLQSMKSASDYELLFIIMANSEFDQVTQLAKGCDYIFLGGNNRRIYDRLQLDYTKKEPDSIVLDLNIRSTGENRSFKKYKCSFGRQKAPAVPFDEIM